MARYQLCIIIIIADTIMKIMYNCGMQRLVVSYVIRYDN
jgi:hypothetical protein